MIDVRLRCVPLDTDMCTDDVLVHIGWPIVFIVEQGTLLLELDETAAPS